MIDLETILRLYPNCLTSRAAFKSILLDRYPDEKRTINILTSIYECGMAGKIQAMSSITADELQKMVGQLGIEYGTSPQYAESAIRIWAAAHAVNIEQELRAVGSHNRSTQTLPVYFLIDRGNHMRGDAIGTMNSALEEFIVSDLPEIANQIGTIVKWQVIEYGTGAVLKFPSPLNIGDVIWDDMHADGRCDFGAAIELLVRSMANDFKKPAETYPLPFVLVAFSGAKCTDDYLAAVAKLNCDRRMVHAVRVGVAIGENADFDALTAFAKSSESVFRINDKWMKWLPRLIQYDDGCLYDEEERW